VIAEDRAVPGTQRAAAFFDFDGTLIAGYSIVAFLKERVRRREIGAGDVLRTAVSVAQSALGRIDSRELIARGIHEWGGRRLADLEELGERLFERDLRELIYPEMRARIAEHRARGHLVAIATSAAPFQVGPVARELGIDHVLCTRLEVRDGVLTGKSSGPVLWGRAKADAVRDFARRHRVDLGRSYFYADGDEDVALMRAVGHPRPTNPRPALAEAAAREGWPVARYTSRGAPGLDAYLRSGLATASAVPVFLGAAAIRALTGDRREAANFLTSTLTEIALALGKVRLNVTGEEHLWSARPAVFIWNHRNIFDAQIVGRLVQRDFGAVAKKELEGSPLFAAAARFMPIAFIDRSDRTGAVAALEPATRLLGQGVSMLVAPEGTRVAGGGIGPFKKGAFRMAMAAGVPIVPIVVRNVDDIGSRSSGTMRPGTVDVAVLPPVDVGDWTLRDLDRRIEQVRGQFVQSLECWPGASPRETQGVDGLEAKGIPGRRLPRRRTARARMAPRD
jgi:putative phosphoserine phosphatase/1-acylglycerol-3-phosphate O-acyltransferase